MCAGLGITAVVAFFVAQSPALVRAIASNRVAVLGPDDRAARASCSSCRRASTRSRRARRRCSSSLYSALTGVTFAFILLAFTGESVATTFIVCAGDVRRDWRSTARRPAAASPAGASSCSWASSASCWRRSSACSGTTTALQFVISFIGVIVFTGLTAYDAQRLKQMALALPLGQIGSYAIVGALTLYLDFINLFLMLLRFTGSRRD